MKKLLLLMGLAAALALLLNANWRPMPMEERLVRLEAEQAFPELARVLRGEPAEVSAVLLDYADDPVLQLKAQAALLARPQFAREILPLYGSEPEFREILRTYGDSVLLPIAYFREHDVRSIALMRYTAEKYEQAKAAVVRLWNSDEAAGEAAASAPAASADAPPASASKAPAEPAGPLDAGQRGWYAVNFIRAEGHDFLGQFAVDAQGQTRWIQTERVLEGANSFFAGGVRTLETKLRTDQAVSAGDVGWATVDALVVVSAVKLLRVGRAASASAKSATVAGRSAAFGARLATVGRAGLSATRYAKWPAIAVAGYVVLRHPTVVSDVLAGVAEVAGLPVMAVQLAGWMLILLPLFYVASWLGWLLRRPVLALTRLLAKGLSRRERKPGGERLFS